MKTTLEDVLKFFMEKAFYGISSFYLFLQTKSPLLPFQM